MPICLDRPLSSHQLWKRTNGSWRRPAVRFRESDAHCIDIGLLNNMPDKALQSTERQLVTLLDAAAVGIVVRLSLYALPDVPRTELGVRHVSSLYSGIERLWDRHLDGLIVTGTEPRAADLMDEPYWDSLIKVLDWADLSTHSTILSCLSAHAALLHFDGIGRRRLDAKRFGIFECARVSNHPLTARSPSHFPMPQSRWNEIPKNDLTKFGYSILTRSMDGGVDSFVKQRQSLFVFFQGHPEYEANTLFHEYRRDVGRYLRRERETYPSMPRHYFDEETTDTLTAFQTRALCDRREEVLADLPDLQIEKRLGNPWRSTAERIYGNWLIHLCVQKERRRARGNVHMNVLSSGVGL